MLGRESITEVGTPRRGVRSARRVRRTRPTSASVYVTTGIVCQLLVEYDPLQHESPGAADLHDVARDRARLDAPNAIVHRLRGSAHLDAHSSQHVGERLGQRELVFGNERDASRDQDLIFLH
ncbi:MAG: hypothetical protein GEU99_02800 [Luteitalea sp.]|nr:hypothetical protein [Luteitalea sp.]